MQMSKNVNNDVSMNPPIDRDVKNNIIDFSLPFVIDVQTIRCVLLVAACEADVSFCFPGGEITQASELAGERRSAPGASKEKFPHSLDHSQFRFLRVLFW